MNDELKNILDEFMNFDFNSQWERIEINEYERNILKDYITNLQHTEDLYNQLLKDYDELQQENERLKEKNKALQEDAWRNNADLMKMVKEELEKTDCEECEICEDYKSRCEKATGILGRYKHLSSPTEEQAIEQEEIFENAYDILNGRSDK